MKKNIIFIILIILLFSCSRNKNYQSEIYSFLNKWSTSIQELEYENYENCTSYVKNRVQFEKKYEDFYFNKITINKIKIEKKMKYLIKFKVDANFYSVNRQKPFKSSDINCIFYIEKSSKGYIVRDYEFKNKILE